MLGFFPLICGRAGSPEEETEAREERGMVPEFALGNSAAPNKIQTIILE
jgi:hypothetical protein